MSDNLIKRASNSDIKKIYHWFYNPVVFFLSDPTLEYPLHQNNWIQLNSVREFYVISDTSVINGCLAVDSDNMITHVYVKKDKRNRGYAKQLINFVCQGKSVSVYLHQKQREHIKLFTGMGFKKAKSSKEFQFESAQHQFDLYRRSQH